MVYNEIQLQLVNHGLKALDWSNLFPKNSFLQLRFTTPIPDLNRLRPTRQMGTVASEGLRDRRHGDAAGLPGEAVQGVRAMLTLHPVSRVAVVFVVGCGERFTGCRRLPRKNAALFSIIPCVFFILLGTLH